MKIELIQKRIEEKTSIFKSRAIKSPNDLKRHDLVKRDEQRAMFDANRKLGWACAKIAIIFNRDQRTVAQCIQKQERALIKSKSGTTVDQQPRVRTPSHRLTRHLDELANTAEILAHHCQKLLRYKDDADVESKGNVFNHILFLESVKQDSSSGKC